MKTDGEKTDGETGTAGQGGVGGVEMAVGRVDSLLLTTSDKVYYVK